MLDAYDNSVKYNAGVDIALYINALFKECGPYAKMKDFASWLDILREIERWIYPKLCKNEKGLEEVQQARINYREALKIFQRKSIKGKKINGTVGNSVYDYCATYEKVLRKWSDKLGYQMPESDDIASAAFR